MELSRGIRILLRDLITGAEEDRYFALLTIGEIAAAHPPREAHLVALQLLRLLRVDSELSRVLLLASLQDIVRKHGHLRAFARVVEEYRNESGLLFLANESPMIRSQAASNLRDVPPRPLSLRSAPLLITAL